MTIWKFPLELTDFQLVNLPKGAKILSVAVQNGTIHLWAMVNPREDYELRTICIFGTGNLIDTVGLTYRFIGTVFERSFVWHVFERE